MNNLFPVEGKYHVTDLFWTLIIVVNVVILKDFRMKTLNPM